MCSSACVAIRLASAAGTTRGWRVRTTNRPHRRYSGGSRAGPPGLHLPTPYGWRAYHVVLDLCHQRRQRLLSWLPSLRFRTPQDYLLLLLAMAAFLALGLRRSRDPFQIGLLVLCDSRFPCATRYLAGSYCVGSGDCGCRARATEIAERTIRQAATRVHFWSGRRQSGTAARLFAFVYPCRNELLLAEDG